MIIKKTAALILVLLLTVCLGAEKLSDNVKKVFEVNNQTKLFFTDIDGNVIIERHDKNEIVFNFTKEISEKESSSSKKRKYYEEIKPVYEVVDGVVRIKVQYPKRKSGIFSGFFNARIKIVSRLTIPANIPVKVKVVDGNIRAENLDNKLYVRTVDGNITINNSKGVLNSVSTDGNLTVRDFTGPVSHTSVDGNIGVSGTISNIRLVSVDGNIKVNFAKGSSLSADSKLKTVDGNIRVLVSADLAAKLYASSVDGRIRITGDQFSKVKQKSKRRVIVSTENAEYEISMRTVDGSISLNSN